MPSYPTEYWNDEAEAAKHLRDIGFTFDRGIIRPPSPDFDFSLYPRALSEAINYLVGEWDYGYEGH